MTDSDFNPVETPMTDSDFNPVETPMTDSDFNGRCIKSQKNCNQANGLTRTE